MTGSDITGEAPRRGFFARLAGATALGLTGLRATRATAAAADETSWFGPLKGRHRQVFDAFHYSDGSALNFAHNFLVSDPEPGAALAVVVLRHNALPIGLNSVIWEKYQIGEALNITDPETRSIAVKNPLLHPKPNVLLADGVAIDRLIAAGVVFGACDMALHGLSKRLAARAGASAEEAAREWTANLVTGVTLIPSGVWGVNRAQEAGCTYCSGG